jgi:hypothetical protein
VRNNQRDFDAQMELKALQQHENLASDRNSSRQRRRSSTAPAGRIDSDPRGTEGLAETSSSRQSNAMILVFKIYLKSP